MFELSRCPSGKSDERSKCFGRFRLSDDAFHDAWRAYMDFTDDLACIRQDPREPEQQDQLCLLDRPTGKQAVGGTLQYSKIRQDFGQEYVRGAVQNEADCPASSVFDNEQDGLVEVRIAERGTGDQEHALLDRCRRNLLLRLSR